jgi:hypothetical protein
VIFQQLMVGFSGLAILNGSAQGVVLSLSKVFLSLISELPVLGVEVVGKVEEDRICEELVVPQSAWKVLFLEDLIVIEREMEVNCSIPIVTQSNTR